MAFDRGSGERLPATLEALFDVRRSQRKTIAPIAGMRGIAVLLVFLTHYASHAGFLLTPGALTARAAILLEQLGHTGVDLFFVISGFLVYGALVSRAQPIGAFLVRRVQRIYPTFLVVLAVYIGLSFLFADAGKLPATWGATVWHIALNALLLPGMIDVEPIVTVAWSLSYEAFFYLVVSMFAGWFGLHAMRPPVRRALLGGLVIAGLVLTGRWYPTHVRLMMFTAGMLLVETIAASRWKGTRPLGLAALAIVAIAIPALSATAIPEAWGYVVLYVCFVILCLDAFSWHTLTGRVLSWAPLRWLGNMSYSYYLAHGLTLKAAFLVFRELSLFPPGDELFWVLLVPMWCATLVPSVGLFLLVEKPYSFNFAAAGAIAEHRDRVRDVESAA